MRSIRLWSTVPFPVVCVALCILWVGACAFAQPAWASGAVARIRGDLQPALSAASPVPSAFAANADSRPLTITVVLKRTDEAGFNRYLQEVYDRSSPEFDRFLSQTQLANRFGPTVSEFDAVRSWLRSEAFSTVQSPANRLSLTVHGTRAAAERAFDTTLRDFRVGSRTLYANVQAPAVPRWAAPDIEAVIGLSSLAEPRAPSAQYKCNHGYPGPAVNGAVTSCTDLCGLALANGVPASTSIAAYGLFGPLLTAIAKIELMLLAAPGKGLSAAFGIYGPDAWLYCAGAGMANSSPGFTNLDRVGVDVERLLLRARDPRRRDSRCRPDAPEAVAPVPDRPQHLVPRRQRLIDGGVQIRKRIVQEIGIGDKRLTRSRKAQLVFLKSFS
ncbi:MAG: protease pro-enzyme activation domain-containing protein [Solirubrobacteraceae bacterium]